MLSQDETLSLIEKAQKGDENSKNILLENNFPLIKSVIKRFKGKGVEYEDLYQLGCVGFLKAISNFNSDFNVKFSTYCVPMVAGEVKRFLRDDGIIKVSRSLKTLSFKVSKYVSTYKCENNGVSPTIQQISSALEVEENDIILAQESSRTLISIDEKIDEDDSRSSSVLDKMASNELMDEKLEIIMLKDQISKLDERDKKVILLRFFRNKTQSEVAQELNVSQVQISRIENRVLEKLKRKLL